MYISTWRRTQEDKGSDGAKVKISGEVRGQHIEWSPVPGVASLEIRATCTEWHRAAKVDFSTGSKVEKMV